jgi:peptide/nickel transport system substrate-binding protein
MSARRIVVGLLTIAALAGTAPAFSETLIVGLSSDVNNWNPGRTSTSVDGGLIEHVYEKLVDFDLEGNPTPALAVAWRVVEPGLWEFQLRPDVTFTNGEPFNAAVVKKNLEFQRDDLQMGARSWLQDIVEVEVIDDLTVHIHTRGPAPELVNALSWTGRMVPLAHGFEANGEYSDRLLNEPVGTGPYRVTRWEKDNIIVLEYNEDWWGPRPDITRVEVRIQPEAVTRTAALLSGEVDFIDNPNPEDLDLIRRTDGLTVEVLSGQRVAYLFMDSLRSTGGAHPDGTPGIAAGQPNPLQDVRVRRALYQAIDRGLIAEELHDGLVLPAYLPILPSLYAFDPDIDPPTYDPEAARALLAEAGYPDGFDIQLTTFSGRLPRDEDTVLFIASQFQEIGVRASVDAYTFTVANQLYGAKEVTMGLQSWGALTMPGTSLEGLVGSYPDRDAYGRQNIGRYVNDDVNGLLAGLAAATDIDERTELFHEFSRVFLEDVPLLPVYYTTNVRAMRDRFQYAPQGVELIYYKDVKIR